MVYSFPPLASSPILRWYGRNQGFWRGFEATGLRTTSRIYYFKGQGQVAQNLANVSPQGMELHSRSAAAKRRSQIGIDDYANAPNAFKVAF